MLDVKSLAVDFYLPSGKVTALKDISFTVSPGETLALVGESGCGKSLTALALMRLLPAQAGVSAGDVVLDGVSLPDLPEDAMCRVRGAKMAMIFQEPATALNPVMTVGEQIAEVIRLHENPGKMLSAKRFFSGSRASELTSLKSALTLSLSNFRAGKSSAC